MKYFLLPDKSETDETVYKIVKVQEHDIPSFLKRNASEILSESTSLPELIGAFISTLNQR